MPRKTSLTLICCLWISCITHLATAQVTCAPVYVTEHAGAGRLETRAVKMLPDGTTIITGRAMVGAGYDGFAMRVAPDGSTIWANTWGGAGDEALTHIITLSNGNILMGGYTTYYAAVGKPWLMCTDINGNVLWSREFADHVTSPASKDRLQAVIQLPNDEIVGTYNLGDSSATSDPVIFKMHLNGTILWARRFDNGGAESFTSLAFDGTNIYAAGYYTTTAKQGVIVQLSSADGALLSAKNIYYYGTSINNMDEQVTGLEIYNNTISYGLHARQTSVSYSSSQLFVTQTDMQGNPRFTVDVPNSEGTINMNLRRTSDGGFTISNEASGTFAPFIVKFTSFGKCEWGRIFNDYWYRQVNKGYDLTPDGGIITAGQYEILYPVATTRMQITRLNAWGDGPACLPLTVQRFPDTATLKEQPLNWTTAIRARISSSPVIVMGQPYTTTETKLCQSTTCIDKTPLPPDCNKTYRIEYGGQSRVIFRDAVTTPDGGRIIAGDLADDGMIIKTGVNGDIIWQKRAFEEFYSSITIMRLLRMPDNTYMVFARTAKTLNHGGWRYMTMFRMDENGNILSSRDIEINGSYMSGEIMDVTQTPDGGFVLLGVDGWGGGSTDCFAIRFDPALNVVWKKDLEHNPLTPVMRSITSTRTAVYIAFDAYDNYNKFSFGLSKLDLATGNMIWGRRFQTDNQDNLERVNRVLAINDTAYVFVNHYVPTSTFTSTRTVLMARIDPQGNVIKTLNLNAGNFVSFNTSEHLDASPPTVTHTTDNDFVLTQRIITTGGTNELNITRLTTDGNIIWSVGHPAMKDYNPFNIHQQANGFMIVGAALEPRANALSFANGFMLKVDSVGQIVYPNTGACSTVQETMAVTPAAITTVPWGSDQTLELTSVVLTTGDIKGKNEYMDATLYCYEPANCSQVTLAQRGNGCAVTDTLVYFLENAGNCGAVATWQYDPLFFKQEYSSSDTLKLIPLQPGASTVKVDMEGHCFQETKTIQASVLLSAANMHLAPDTVICEGGAIRISAGPGYTSYQWNNNTTDSFLIVNAPGKYYVDVTDNCGGTGTDTIVVTRAGATFSVATPTATKCNNDPIQLQAIGGFINYQWNAQDGYQEQGISVEVNPAVTTKYYVEAEKWPGCKVRDSITVNVLNSPAITLPPDATICRGDSVLLDAGPSFTTYNWNTGNTTQQLKAKTAGKYKVEATWTNGCRSKDSFELRFHNDPTVSLDKNPVLCKDASKTLSPGAYNAYVWNDGSTGATLTVNGTGTWWVTITDQNGCKASDTTTINTIAPLPANFMNQQTEICQYGELKLVPAVSFKEYHWSDRSTGTSLTINKAGEYWLQATDHNNCTGADTIKVIQKECLIGLYIPNAFTPNGDRNNDMFTPMLYGNAENIRFSVYNRYGQIVFETTTMKQGWDGKIKGIEAVAGTYVWQCRYKLAGQPEKFEKGIVQLIR